MSESPDVLDGALRIAREEYPDLDIPAYRGRVEEFARQAGGRVRGSGRAAIEALNDHFFGRLGFHGNTKDYYDPRNSYLNEVIDRRTGIPITLAAVYCEVGRRLGLPAAGVSFPGHFLVRCATPRSETIVDCFHAKVLSRDDCQALLDSMFPGKPRLEPSMLEPAPPREILARMLNNLRHIHTARKEFGKVLRWISLDLELRPYAMHNYRDRGMLHIEMEEFGKAVEDLERYAGLSPAPPDLDEIREQLRLVRKLLSHLN